ncbi:hypothetical protein V6N13_028047 [Hibiscus sabdariffa]
MADLEEISTKRKRQSLRVTRSLMGSFSGSKSQIKSATNHRDLQPFVKKLKNNSPAEGSSMGYNLSSVSIKRVFSPSEGVVPNSSDETENPGKSQIAGIRLGGTQELDVSNKNFLQSTPPDVVKRNGTEFSEQFSEKKPCEMEANYSMKSDLKPCSRARFFRTPGSFSYRRLLPYLTDIEKDSSGSQLMGQCQNYGKGFEDKHLPASNSPETLPDTTTSCSLEIHNTDSGNSSIVASVEPFTSKENESSSMPLVNGEIQKLELQASCGGTDLTCSKNGSSTTEDSHFDQENLAGVVSSNKIMTDNGEVAKTNVEYPCNARSLEAFDQTLSTFNDKCESCEYEVAESSKDDTNKSEIQGIQKVTICDSFECQHLNSVDPTSSEMEGNRKCSLHQRGDNDGEVLERVEDLNGECMSTAPPDSNVFSKYEIDDRRGNMVDHVSRGIDQVTRKSTNETFCRNNGQDCDKSPDSSPKNKTVPNPHLHLKLSKIPGSFSFRRLLPYLINITDHNSCASGNIQSMKVEKSSIEKPFSPFFTSGKDKCTETINGKSRPVEHHTGADIKLPAVAATAMASSNHKLTQSPPKQVAESPMIMDSQQEPTLLVKPSASGTSQKVESRPKDVVESPAMPSSSLINSGLLPREEAKLASCQSPLETEEDCIKSTEKCANHERKIEADSLVEASTPPAMPSASLQKGILKRNPRGCRGICTCLICSSFQLHAEKTFEFSRNQMQDAEEMALDLIKEISCLRNMLEKSAFVSKDRTNICIDQVKEACKKALDAEELAKARLDKMNYHLNIHCRIPRLDRISGMVLNEVMVKLEEEVSDKSASKTSINENAEQEVDGNGNPEINIEDNLVSVVESNSERASVISERTDDNFKYLAKAESAKDIDASLYVSQMLPDAEQVTLSDSSFNSNEVSTKPPLPLRKQAGFHLLLTRQAKQHTPLKNLLGEAVNGTKPKSPNTKEPPREGKVAKDNGAMVAKVSSILGPESPDTKPTDVETVKEWNSPARYQADIKREKRKVKGRPLWAQFVCCSYVK